MCSIISYYVHQPQAQAANQIEVRTTLLNHSIIKAMLFRLLFVMGTHILKHYAQSTYYEFSY